MIVLMLLDAIIFVVIAVLGAVSIFYTIKLSRQKKGFTASIFESDSREDLPTVSVCVPARNEAHAMTACLESVLSSDYEKLEIIVLDDNSNDNTSTLIQSFAQAGVRFVEGSELQVGWLGKNHALQNLLEEASGHYILFVDVDTRIKPDTISNLIFQMQHKHLKMASVIPRRNDGLRLSVLFGGLRYLRLLIFSSSTNPAISSSFWCVNRQFLQSLGGFSSFKSIVQPEISVASAVESQSVKTFLSNKALSVSFEKKWSSQVETSIRLLSPASGGGVSSFAWLLFLVVLAAYSLVVPLGIWQQNFWVVGAGIFFWATMSWLFWVYFSIVWSKNFWMSIILWPFLVIQEMILLVMSMVQYSRGQVSWKGRRISVSKTSV